MRPPDTTSFATSAAFWHDVATLIEKFDIERSDRPAPARPCPKVFVYDLARGGGHPLSDYDHKRGDAAQAFGELVSGGSFSSNLKDPAPPPAIKGGVELRRTADNSLLILMLQRLSQPTSQCATTDPAEAELFLVPIMPKVCALDVDE